MIIKVTQEHIDEGFPGEADSCPVALAIQQKTGDLHATVNAKCIFFRYRSKDKTRKTPKKVVNFIKKFDSGDKVKPFSFELSV